MTASVRLDNQTRKHAAQNARDYIEFIEPGILLEDAMSRHYWQTRIPHMRIGDVVSLVADDGSFDVEVRVTHLRADSIQFRVLREWRRPLDGADSSVFDADMAHFATSKYSPSLQAA